MRQNDQSRSPSPRVNSQSDPGSLIRQFIQDLPQRGTFRFLAIHKEQLLIEAYGRWAAVRLTDKLVAERVGPGTATQPSVLLARKGAVLTECQDRLDQELAGIVADAGRGRHALAPRDLRGTILKHVDDSMNLVLAAFAVRGAGPPKARKSGRRNTRYQAIDRALAAIAQSRPNSHADAFRHLQSRNVAIPFAEPFQSTGGWLAGFKKDPRRARAWLSKAWARLGLPAFPKGRTQLP